VGTTSILPPSCARNTGSFGSKQKDWGYDGLAVIVKITFSTGVGTWDELLRSQGVGHIYASREVVPQT
jgi:hypothetical protein